MSVDNVRTVTGSRPELAQLPVNAPLGYVGTKIFPVTKLAGKAGTYYYSALDADATATTSRSAGAAPVAVTIAEASAAWSATELIKRYKMPWEMIPLIGGLEKADARGARASVRSVQNALEKLQLTALITAAGTSATSAIQDGVINAADYVHRYNGKTAFVCNVGTYRWLIQQTEIKNMLVRTYGGLGYTEALSLAPQVFKASLQTLFAVDEVLVADDMFWPLAYMGVAAVVKIPDGTDDLSFVDNPEYGRTMVYWPTDAVTPYEVNSFPDDDLRSNIFDAVVWQSIEEMNSGAKFLLALSSVGSTTT